MPTGSTVLNRAAETFGAYLPRIGACLALLIAGYLIAAVASRLVSKGLAAVGFDTFADRVGVTQDLARIGTTKPPSRIVGAVLKAAILIIAVVAAISALGLSALNASLNETVLFVPKLIAALLLVIAGVALGRLVRTRVERSATRMDLAGPLGPVTEGLIIAAFAATALAQLSISLAALTLIIAIIIAAAAFGVALAFGLGSRDTARQISAGRTITTSLRIGQHVSVAGYEGRIDAFHASAVLLRTPEGFVRVPNHVLLESVITLRDDDPPQNRP